MFCGNHPINDTPVLNGEYLSIHTQDCIKTSRSLNECVFVCVASENPVFNYIWWGVIAIPFVWLCILSLVLRAEISLHPNVFLITIIMYLISCTILPFVLIIEVIYFMHPLPYLFQYIDLFNRTFPMLSVIFAFIDVTVGSFFNFITFILYIPYKFVWFCREFPKTSKLKIAIKMYVIAYPKFKNYIIFNVNNVKRTVNIILQHILGRILNNIFIQGLLMYIKEETSNILVNKTYIPTSKELSVKDIVNIVNTLNSVPDNKINQQKKVITINIKNNNRTQK